VLLQRGYHVLGTVRSDEKGNYLRKLYKDDPRFSYTIVTDLETPDGFDESVKDVEGVLHVVSVARSVSWSLR
jgi:nucleoside-diphosphate-sugar epimerase